MEKILCGRRRAAPASWASSPDGKEDRALTALACQLDGYRLTTAEIVYRLPDHPRLLQTYVWQDYDIAPRFPVLRRFLDFWQRDLDGRLHEVRVTSTALVRPAELRLNAHILTLH
jgi:uncharacterized protein Usg